MHKIFVIGITVTVLIIIIGGFVGWALMNSQPAGNIQSTPTPQASSTPEATPSESPEPETVTQEQVRDAAMTYIKANHAGTAQLMTDLSWTGGRATPEGLVGYETYIYNSTNWNVTIGYPVTLNIVYTITTNYSAGDVTVTWEGTYQNGIITEANYNQNNLVIIYTQEEIRDAAMTYMQTNHEETAELMINLSWTGGRVDTGLLGAELYNYTSANWTVAMRYPVIQYQIYTITVNYSANDVTVIWEGTFENGTIIETRYNQNNLIVFTTQEQVRNAIMNYIKINHNETAVYMQDLSWTGGLVNQGMMVGSSKYNYQSLGWNMTMQYPIVPNPIYTIIVNYYSPLSQVSPAQNIIAWEGTWQNGTITQTSYVFTP